MTLRQILSIRAIRTLHIFSTYKTSENIYFHVLISMLHSNINLAFPSIKNTFIKAFDYDLQMKELFIYKSNHRLSIIRKYLIKLYMVDC
jgi:hypothetical protein